MKPCCVTRLPDQIMLLATADNEIPMDCRFQRRPRSRDKLHITFMVTVPEVLDSNKNKVTKSALGIYPLKVHI